MKSDVIGQHIGQVSRKNRATTAAHVGRRRRPDRAATRRLLIAAAAPAAVLAFTVGVRPASAATNTVFTLSGSNASLDIGSNWTNTSSGTTGTIPSVGGDAVIGTSTTTTGTDYLGHYAATETFGSLDDLSSNALTIRNYNSSGSNINDVIVLGGTGNNGNAVNNGSSSTDLLFVASGANLTIMNYSSGGSLGLVINQGIGAFDIAGTATISSVISDGGNGYALTKTGAGTLTLTGSNTYSGGTNISAGTLQYYTSSAIGTGNVSIGAAATLYFHQTDVYGAIGTIASNVSLGSATTSYIEVGSTSAAAVADNLTISGSVSGGGLYKQGYGVLILTGNNTYGVTNLASTNGGTLQIGNGGTTGTLGTGAVTINSSDLLAFNQSGTISVTNKIGGSGAVEQDGSGVLILSPTTTNSYSGGTTINNGVLQIASPSAIGTLGATINSGALRLDYPGSSATTVATTASFVLGSPTSTIDIGAGSGFDSYQFSNGSGNLTGSGTLNLNATSSSDTGSLYLTTANGYTGGTNISAGTLQYFVSGAIGTGNVSIGAGTLLFHQSGVAGSTGTIASNVSLGSTASTIAVGSSTSVDTLTISGTVTGTGGALNKAGIGTLVLAGSDSYAGGTNISSGAVEFHNAVSVPSGTVNVSTGAMVIVGVGGGAQVAAGGVASVLSSPNIFASNASIGFDTSGAGSSPFVYGGSITNTSGGTVQLNLVKFGAGTLVLTGANSYGTTNISAGTLQIGNGSSASTGTLGTGAVTDSGVLAFNQSGTITVANSISGTGSLEQDGTGVLVLATSNAYSGGTSINSGVISVGDTTFLGSAAAPGITIGSGTLLDTYSGSINTGRIFNLTSATSDIDVKSGTFQFYSGFSLTGSGTLNVNGHSSSDTGTLWLNGSSGYTGGTVLVRGTLQLGNNGALGSTTAALTVNAGTLDLTTFSPTVGAVTLVSGTIQSTGSTSAAITALSYLVQSGTVSAVMNGSGGLTKTTAGSVTLSGLNGYSGGTTVSAGALSVPALAAAGTAQPLGEGGTVTLGGTSTTGTLQYTGGTGTMSQAVTVGAGGGVISNTGGSTLTLAGTLTKNGTVLTLTNGTTDGTSGGTFVVSGQVTGSAANSDLDVATNTTLTNTSNNYNGPTYVYNGATLTDNTDNAGAGALPSSTTVNLGTASAGNTVTTATGTLDLDGNSQTIAGLNGTATSVVTNGSASATAATLTVSGGGSFAGTIQNGTGQTALTVSGGTLTLTGSNTYTGTTTLGGGTLNVGSAGAIGTTGTLSFTGGTLQYSAANQTDYSARFSTTGSQAYSVDTNGQSVTYATGLSSTGGSLTKLGSGTLALTGSSSYDSGTTVSAGELRANNAASSTGTGTVTVAAGATLGGSGTIANGTNAITVNGTITAGQDASTVGTLTTGTQAWNAGGTFLVKTTSPDSGATIGSNDQLVMSALTVPSTGTFTISLPSLTSNPTSLGTTGMLILADDTDSSASTNPFSTTNSAATLSVLTLNTPNFAAPLGYVLSTASDSASGGSGKGGYSLVLVAAPEPTSVLLLGSAVAPLLLGRRSRRRPAMAGQLATADQCAD